MNDRIGSAIATLFCYGYTDLFLHNSTAFCITKTISFQKFSYVHEIEPKYKAVADGLVSQVLAGLSHQNWSSQTDFGCQNWSPLAKTISPWESTFAESICQNQFPTKVALIFMHGYMDVRSYYIIYS